MAKVGFWLQGATGKLAGSALQKGVNGTVIRQVVKPKNPKTVNQTLQRVLMNTVSQAYSALQVIACHSFQGKTEGAQNMAAFQKANLSYFRKRASEVPEEQLSAYVNFVPVGQKGIRPARFIVSEGTLPRVPMAINQSFNAVLPLDANTYAGVISKYNLKRGDQITFVVIEESTVQAGEYVAKYARIILDPRDSEGSEAPLSSAFIADNAIYLPNSKNQGNFGLLQFTEGVGVEFSMKNNAKVCAVGCIVSRLDGEEWKRSNCQLIVSEDAIGEYGISLARAITLSREGNSVYITDANQYLDNAGVSGGQSTTSGSGESEEEIDSTPTFNNTVGFAASNQADATFTNNDVSGGSVSIAAPFAKMKITGNNLGTANVVVKNGDAEVGSWTKTNNSAIWSTNSPYEGGSSLSVYKNNALWFTISVEAGGFDEP